MSWYKHWLVWGVAGGGTGYLVGSQKYIGLKHEEIITTIVGAITGAATAALINKFTTPKAVIAPATVPQQIPQTPAATAPPANTSASDYGPVQSSPQMMGVDVRQAEPIPPEIDDELQGSSIMDESMLSWDEDEDEE